MIPENEAQRLIDQLERHSRRSRPFLIYGLVAILAGFLILTFYINGLRTAAEARARDLETKKVELTQRIDQAGRLAAGRYSPTETPKVLKRISSILAAASETTEELDASTKEAEPAVAAASHQPDAAVKPSPPTSAKTATLPKEEPTGTAAPVRPAVIRIFLHIPGKDQFGGAKELQWSLASKSFDGSRIVVPGIEIVDRGDDTLRCLKRADCARVEALAALINGRLRGRSLTVRELSRTYEHARNVRPGTYEVWLAPGPVLVAAE